MDLMNTNKRRMIRPVRSAYNFTGWVPDSSIIGGLSDQGSFSSPTVYFDEVDHYLICGYDGSPYFYCWKWSYILEEWVFNSYIQTGLSLTASQINPWVFNVSGNTYILIGVSTNSFGGYVRDYVNEEWDNYSNIANGLASGGYGAPTVFDYQGSVYTIYGNFAGNLQASILINPSTGWTPDSDMSNGLTSVDVGYKSSPTVFTIGTKYYLISGSWGGSFYGWEWDGSEWDDINNSTIVNGISSTPKARPYTFWKDGNLYMIIGTEAGTFEGYRALL